MARKQFITLAALASLALAGTAARADDITMADESFMSGKTRAEVQAEVLKARADGMVFASEIDLAPTMRAKAGSVVSREQVRAEVGDAARKVVMQWYPA
jgi:Domain of unknown function (DUF4148)